VSVFIEAVTVVSIIEAVTVVSIIKAVAAVSIIEAYSSKFQLSPVGCHLIQYLCIIVIFRASISITITWLPILINQIQILSWKAWSIQLNKKKE